jgi:hypothetical protein
MKYTVSARSFLDQFTLVLGSRTEDTDLTRPAAVEESIDPIVGGH